MAGQSAVETTIRLLEQSKSTTAQAVLMHAVSVEDQSIRDAAARAILRSGTAVAKTEVIRQVNRLSPEFMQELSRNDSAISFPLKQCLQHGDVPSTMMALETIEAAHLYQEIPTLLEFLTTATGEAADRAEQAFLGVVDHLYETIREIKQSEPSAVVHQAEELVQLLGVHLSRFENMKRPRAMIEAILILTHPEHTVARQLIRESSAESQAIAWEVLNQSRHQGVTDFIIQSMSLKYIHPRLLEIFSRRRDIEFQLAVVSQMPNEFSVNQSRNYCQLQALPWLYPGEEIWQRFPEKWHWKLLKLVDAMPYQLAQKAAFLESALKHASVEGKSFAVQRRHLIKPQHFEQLIVKMLDSTDEQIEAWAVSELRNTDLPDKYRYLVNRLDSPRELVSQEARKALGRFDAHSAIMYCESARAAVGPRIAELLLKINPDAPVDLCRELAHPVRSRRLRAAKASAIMQIEHLVRDALLELLYDNDAVVRRAVAEILASVPEEPVIAGLTMLLDDSSMRVREAAQASLDAIQKYLQQEQSRQDAAESDEYSVAGEDSVESGDFHESEISAETPLTSGEPVHHDSHQEFDSDQEGITSNFAADDSALAEEARRHAPAESLPSLSNAEKETC